MVGAKGLFENPQALFVERFCTVIAALIGVHQAQIVQGPGVVFPVFFPELAKNFQRFAQGSFRLSEFAGRPVACMANQESLAISGID